VNLSPTYSQTFVNYSTPNDPVPFLSNTSKSCCKDFSLFVSVENPNIYKNAGKSIYDPSVCVVTKCNIFPASFSSPKAFIAVINY
jgi:hypothetical protein